MQRDQRQYLSFLLRLWQIKSGGQLVWRASLEDSRTGETAGFATIDALFEFLQQQMRVASDAKWDDNDEGTESS